MEAEQNQKLSKEPLNVFILNPFAPNAPFFYPLKTSENRKVNMCYINLTPTVNIYRSNFVFTDFNELKNLGDMSMLLLYLKI